MSGFLVFVAAGAGIGTLCAALLFTPAVLARRRTRAGTAPDAARLAATVPLFAALDATGRRRLARQVGRFCKTKRIRTPNGETPSIMALAVAANACMLRLGPGADCYPSVREIVLDGRANPPGQLAVDWGELQAAIDGGPRNPVVSACAGLLLAAGANGKRDQGAMGSPEQWWQRYAQAQTRIDRDASPVLASHDDQPELFVAASVAFFQRGPALARHHGEVYALLSEFYALESAAGAVEEGKG